MEIFKLVEHFHATLLLMSAPCITWNRHKLFLTLFHFTQIALPLLLHEYKDNSLVKQMSIFSSPVESSTIPGHFMWQ